MSSPRLSLCASFVILGLARAVSSTFAILILPIQAELESGRGLVTLIVTVHLIFYSLASIACGLLIDRLGPRATIALGGLLMGIGLIGMSLAHTLLWLSATFGVLCGTGVALSGMPANYVIISESFPKRVATATSIAGSGMGIGVLLIVPLAQWGVERLGWRAATGWMGAGVAAAVLVCTWLQRAPHAPAPDRTQAAARELRRPEEPGSLAKMRAVLLARSWQGFALANALMGAAVFAIMTHQVAAISKAGWSGLIAAATLGAVNLFRSLSSPVWGALIDRYGRRALYGLSTGIAVAGVVTLVAVEAVAAPWVLPVIVFIVAFGVGSAGTMPTNASLGNELFSSRDRGIAWGMTEAAYAAGAAFGAWSAGKIFDMTGAYAIAFLIAAAELLASFVLVSALSPRSSKLQSAGVH